MQGTEEHKQKFTLKIKPITYLYLHIFLFLQLISPIFALYEHFSNVFFSSYVFLFQDLNHFLNLKHFQELSFLAATGSLLITANPDDNFKQQKP